MSDIIVRAMREQDLERVASLGAELGYPSTADEIRARFVDLAARPEALVESALFVASRGGEVIGWIQVRAQRPLESVPNAEITAIVIAAAARRTGAGRALVARAETWARARDLAKLRVRSNVTRKESHEFYAALGFHVSKTQHVYERALAGANAPGSAPHVIVWEFRAREGREAEFERAYGPRGAWARLFEQGDGYLGSELVCDASARRRYLTIDRWSSAAAFDRFHATRVNEYEALDVACEPLTESEQEIAAGWLLRQ